MMLSEAIGLTMLALPVWLTLPTVYAFCLLLGLGYTLMAALLGSIGGGHGGDFGHGLDIQHDFDLHADHGATAFGHHGQLAGGAHLGPFSPLIIALFLTCFGGTGLLCTRVMDLGALSVAPAAGSSLAFAAACIWMFNRLFARIEAASQALACDLIGRSAQVITPIPQGPGAGQVAYVIRGSRYTLTARTEDAIAMPAGAEAIILRVVGPSCFVVPASDARAAKAMKQRAQIEAVAKA